MNNEVANSQSIILNALIAALRNSGNLDVETFKRRSKSKPPRGQIVASTKARSTWPYTLQRVESKTCCW